MAGSAIGRESFENLGAAKTLEKTTVFSGRNGDGRCGTLNELTGQHRFAD